MPVAGGGGEGAMTALKAMVAAGNPPTASQILGYFALDYAEAGKLGDITSLATKEGWDKVVPKALQKFTTTNGKWDAVPVNIHSVNWVWINKAVMDKIGGSRAEELRRLHRAARQGQGGRRHSARARRPALAGSDDVRLGRDVDRRRRLLQEGVRRSRSGGAEIRHDEEGVRQPRPSCSAYTDPNFAGRDWNLATAMVIKGDALVQVMGDWAKGEFKAANKEAGKDFLCYRFPGTDGSVIYNTDMFAMFKVSADRKAAQLALADATMSPSFQSAFNVVKGSVPARMDVPDTAFDMCGKKGIADVKAANADGKFVGSMAQNYAQPPAIAGAYHDVVTKFFHGEIKTSDERRRGTRQGDRRRQVRNARRSPLARGAVLILIRTANERR